MLLKLTHQTDLTYSDLISESVMELRMAPRQEQDQHRLSFSLAIGPATSVSSYFDWLANTVHAFTINAFHRDIKIVATSVIETDRPEVDINALSDAWPLNVSPSDHKMYDFLHFSGPIVDSPALRDVLLTLHVENGVPLGELALRMMALIGERYVYKKGVTNADSPITDMLEHGAGVCQDFTQLMIGLARGLGIPARYVSGLVHPDAEKFKGYSETHAWCELYFPSTGWIGFDPTNQCVVSNNFVKVAIGRDYEDVAPNRGVYRGNADESIEVTVHSEPLPNVPSELAAERMQSLQVPTYAASLSAHHEMTNHQQEHQQQQ